ncbi:hypothetical protein Q7P37_011047 [Cladosporium fusiforme]
MARKGNKCLSPAIRAAGKSPSLRGRACAYAHDPGEAPLPALKRKYDDFQARSADEHELIETLRSSSEQEAIELLARIRSRDMPSALRRCRSLRPTEDRTPLSRESTRQHSSGEASRRESLSCVDDIATPTTINPYPDLDTISTGTSWALPIEPSTADPPLENSSHRQTIRTTPSMPEMSTDRISAPTRKISHSAPRSDPRLDRVKAADWGVTYVTDGQFRKIFTAYFTWDQPLWNVFDADEFCKALEGEPSELSSRLLVLAMFAYAAKQYVYFDPRLSRVHQQAWIEAQRLWQESISKGEESIATACASVAMSCIYAYDGADSLDKEVILRGQRILLRQNMFYHQLVDEVYGESGSTRFKTRALLAWGMIDFVTCLEYSLRNDVRIISTPPVPPPALHRSKDSDTWTPWPLLRPITPACTEEYILARTKLFAIFRDTSSLREECDAAGISHTHFKTAMALSRRLLGWMDILPPDLSLARHFSQHLIILHVHCHFGIVELFRPFTSSEPAAQNPNQSFSEKPTKSITELAKAVMAEAIKEMHQLLVRHEVLYGGLGCQIFLCTPTLAVVFEALPTASPTSKAYSPSSHMSLLTAIRALARMSLVAPVVNLAILGIQQAALRSSLELPPECDQYLREATLATETSSERKDALEGSAYWVIDLSRSATDLESARLDSLVAETKEMKLGEQKKEEE